MHAAAGQIKHQGVEHLISVWVKLFLFTHITPPASRMAVFTGRRTMDQILKAANASGNESHVFRSEHLCFPANSFILGGRYFKSRFDARTSCELWCMNPLFELPRRGALKFRLSVGH
ncbi:hypothetical protein AZ34_14505 [Hylemonella gracilis str. Niagara R]|uniref:Uncharacterized protein n=1 Tax=Hylemonella gracilis str. Niagara R TaxID=1458275 RepID=A0A016XM87_9BURK|nr:hypothetical protein AZ34_14505 [Hylemonella gracilis str. Niagara R]